MERGTPVARTLVRRRIRPGMEAEVDRWMDKLRARRDECIATLDRERMAVELIYRERRPEGEALTWVVVHAPGGRPLEGSPFAIDEIHRSYVERCLDADSLETIEAELFLAPPEVEEAIGRFVARTTR